MNPTLRVFLCGTFADLSGERKAVLDAVERLGMQRGSMELFGAQADQPIDVCLREVRQSDVLIIIVAHMYGTLVPGDQVSFSEAEYREGYLLGKPCLVYLKSEEVPTLPRHFESDPEKLTLLHKYRDLLRSRHTYCTYADSSTLAVQVVSDLVRTKEQIANGGLTPHALPSFGPILHTSDLARLQDSSLSEVWVYAPHPLETVVQAPHRDLRKRVCANLLHGVRYAYFVESEAGVARIEELLRLMSEESGGAEVLSRLRRQTTIVVFSPADFLTHYTVHIRPGSAPEVFQSLITPDRNDEIMKLAEERGKHICGLISERVRSLSETVNDGLRVLRGSGDSRGAVSLPANNSMVYLEKF